MPERYSDSTSEELHRLEELLFGKKLTPSRDDVLRSIDTVERRRIVKKEGVPGGYEGSPLQKILAYLSARPSFERPDFVADTPEARREVVTETLKHPIGSAMPALGALISTDPAKKMFAAESALPALARGGIEALTGQRSFGESYLDASQRARGGQPVTYGDVALAATPEGFPLRSQIAGAASIGGAFISPFNAMGLMSLTGKGLALKRFAESGASLEKVMEIANADRAANLARGVKPHIDDMARAVKQIVEAEGEAGLKIPATNAGKIRAGQMQMGGLYPTRNPLKPFSPDAPINFTTPEFQRNLEGAIVGKAEDAIRGVKRLGPVSDVIGKFDRNVTLPSEMNAELQDFTTKRLDQARFEAQGKSASKPARLGKEVMFGKEPTEPFARLKHRAGFVKPVTTAEDLDVAGRLIEERFKSVDPADHAANIEHIFGTTADDDLAAMVWEPAYAVKMEDSMDQLQKGIEVMDRALAATPDDPELLAARQSLGHWYSRLEGAHAKLPETETGFIPGTAQLEPVPYPPTLDELGGEMTATDKKIQGLQEELRKITARGETAVKRFNAAAGNPEVMKMEMDNYAGFVRQQDQIARRLTRLEAERGNITAAQGAREQLEKEAKDLIETHHKGELVNSPASEILPEVKGEIEQADRMAMKYGETNKVDAARFASKANQLRSETIAERAARLSGGDPVKEERLLSEYLAAAGTKAEPNVTVPSKPKAEIFATQKKNGFWVASVNGEPLNEYIAGNKKVVREFIDEEEALMYARAKAGEGKVVTDRETGEVSFVEYGDVAPKITPPEPNVTYKSRFPERADGTIVLPDPNTYKGPTPKPTPAPAPKPTPKQIEEILANDESFMTMARRYAQNEDGTIDPKKVKEILKLAADNAAARDNIARELSNDVIRATPNQRRVSGLIRDFFEDYVHAQGEAGTLSESLDNYLKHMITDDGKVRGSGIGTLKGQLIPKPSHTKQRVLTLGSTLHEMADAYTRSGSSKTMNKDLLNLAGIYSKQAEHQMALKSAAEDILNEVGLPLKDEAVSATAKLKPQAALMAKNGYTKDQVHRANMMDKVFEWKRAIGGSDRLEKEISGFMRNADPDNLSLGFRKVLAGKAQGMTVEQTLDSGISADLSHLTPEQIQKAFDDLTDPMRGELVTLRALENSPDYLPVGMYVGRFGLDNLAAMTADDFGENGAAILEQVKAWSQGQKPGQYHFSVPEEMMADFEALSAKGKVKAWMIPKQVEERLNKYIFDFGTTNPTPAQIGEWGRMMEGVKSFYSRATILPWASSHLQNLIGGHYNAYVFGGMSVHNEKKAIEILMGDRGRVWTNAFGDQMTGAQLIEAFENSGAMDYGQFSKKTLDEHLNEESKIGKFFHPITEGPVDFGRKVFSSSENSMKFSFGFDQWMKGLDVEHASNNVRNLFFDYGDLTKSEKAIRRYVPFYTFPRKQIPLVLREFAHRPYLMSADYKFQDAIQLILGQQFTGEEMAGQDPYTARSFPVKLGEREGRTVKYNLGNLSPIQAFRDLNPTDPKRAIQAGLGMVAPYLMRAPNLLPPMDFDLVRWRRLGRGDGSRDESLGISMYPGLAHFINGARVAKAAEEIAFNSDIDEDAKLPLWRRVVEGFTGFRFGEYDPQTGIDRRQTEIDRKASERERSMTAREESTAFFGPPTEGDYDRMALQNDADQQALDDMLSLPDRLSKPDNKPFKRKKYEFRINP
jgi:hypothetical protein